MSALSLHVDPAASGKRAKLNATAKVFSPMTSPKSTPASSSSPQYDMSSPEADPLFRSALDAVFGLPYGGSLAFVRNGMTNESVTEFNSFGEGPVYVPTVMILPEKLAVSAESTGLGCVDDPCAKLLVNGRDYSQDQPGFNFLVIDTDTLEAHVAIFNTSSQIGNESKHMAQFIYAIAPSAVVLMAVKGDGVRRLHPIARQALAYLGVEIPAADNAQALKEVIAGIPCDDANAADLLNVCAIVNAAKCAKVLVDAGWNVNHQKSHGTMNTPLLDAVFYGSFAVVRVLIRECNADAGIKNKWQETAEGIAEKLFGLTLASIVDDEEQDSQLPKSPTTN